MALAAALLGSALVALLATCAAAKPVTLVDSAGKLASNRDLISLSSRTGEKATVVAAVGGKGSRKTSLLNAAFGTTFDTTESFGSGDAAAATPSTTVSGAPGLIVLSCDGVTSDTEAKLAALSTSVADVVILHVYASDLGRCVAANTRALKAIFTARLASETAAAAAGAGAESSSKDAATQVETDDAEGDSDESKDEQSQSSSSSTKAGTLRPLPLLVAVHDCDAAADAEGLMAAVTADVRAVWDEMSSTFKDRSAAASSLSDHVSIRLAPVPHPRYQAAAYARAVDALKESLNTASGSTGGARPSAAFAGRVTSAWTSIKRAPAPPPARAELVPLYMVESAGAIASSTVDNALNGWRRAIGRGRSVSGFGTKAAALKKDVLARFDAATVSYSATPLRAQRRAELVSVLDSGVSRLFSQQVTMLASNALRAYKREMLALLNSDKLNEESEASLLRKTLFEFESTASDLLPDTLPDLSFEAEYEDLEAELCDFSDKFGDSPAAQARALAKMDKQVSKGPSGEGPGSGGRRDSKRSISAGLGLVAFVRQEGLGNIQAFSGYRKGPHTVTLGYANDGLAADAMQDGEPSPLLRLQPKLNLDIDL